MLLLALAVLLSGFGHGVAAQPHHEGAITHSQGQGHAHADAGHDHCATGKHHGHGSCPGAEAPDAPPMSQQHDKGGCCGNICFPTGVARDDAAIAPARFDLQTLSPGVDQAPAPTAATGLFRPPRERV